MIHARAVPERSTRTAAEGEGGRQLIAVELVVELTCDGRASRRGIGLDNGIVLCSEGCAATRSCATRLSGRGFTLQREIVPDSGQILSTN